MKVPRNSGPRFSPSPGIKIGGSMKVSAPRTYTPPRMGSGGGSKFSKFAGGASGFGRSSLLRRSSSQNVLSGKIK